MALKPPVEVPQGAIRLNTDSQKLEFFAQDQWWEMATDTSTLNGGGRIAFAAGNTGNNSDVIDYVTVSTAGNAIDFGDITTATSRPGGCASRVRGLVAGGSQPTYVNTIEYITISSTGDATNFGDLTADPRWYCNAVASPTRGVFAGGYTPVSPAGNRDTLDYVTIAATGNAVDFGNLIGATREHSTGSNSTRGLIAGGKSPGPGIINTIQYITIASTGNSQDFGDANTNCSAGSAASSTRMLMGGGLTPSANNVIEYITMATLGNSTDFGDLTTQRGLMAIGVSSDKIRGIFAGGISSDVIDYVSIATQGDAVDFGNLTAARYSSAAMSNDHGGL